VGRENSEPTVQVLGGSASKLGKQFGRQQSDGPADGGRLHLGDGERRAAAGRAALAAPESAGMQSPLPPEIVIRRGL
jgi:hypothetical protein